ncbi:radical SAM protein [Candidatus Parcubacteria bacterium]|nr:radical SAM protein [Candidatus Parcubacteria bacterium]
MEREFNPQFDSQKITYHPDWIKRWHEDPFSVPPIYIEVSPIGSCNHRCTFCAKDVMGYPDRSLSILQLTSFIRELAALRDKDPHGLGVKSLMFAGEGEPTLHRELSSVINMAARSGIETALTTNATGLTRTFCFKSLKYLSWIKASINAGTKEGYTRIHQAKPYHWDIVWKNLARAVEMRNKYSFDCEIGCQTVLLVNDTIDVSGDVVPSNWREAPLLARKAKETGLDHVVIKPYGQNPYSSGSMGRYGLMTYKNITKELEEIESQLREMETETFKVVFRWKAFLDHQEDDRKYEKCLATPMSWAYLQSDGMIISCAAHNSNPDFDLGNINEKTFKEIWWGEGRRKHIEFMKNFDISVCRKNCRMHNVNEALEGLRAHNSERLGSELIQIQQGQAPKNVNFI